MAEKSSAIFSRALVSDNAVVRQILGICSALAVTNFLSNTLFMCAGVTFTTAFSCLVLSALRNYIPQRVRMITQVFIISCFVMIVDIVIQAADPDVHRFIGPYVGLIITNCIIMGRAEAFALTNRPMLSLVDGITAGIGYSWVLMVIAFLRELMGSGTVWGIAVLGDWWVKWSIMVMAPGAFFMLALFVWVVKGRFLRDEGGVK